MKSEQQAEVLRAALAKADRSGAGSPYPEPLRRAAVNYHRQRQEQGASVRVVAAELGVSGLSLSRWSRHLAHPGQGDSQHPGFRAIELVAEPARFCGPLVVHGPRGLRIEGLTVADVVELFERLS